MATQASTVKDKLLKARLPAKAGLAKGVTTLTVAEVDYLLDLLDKHQYDC